MQQYQRLFRFGLGFLVGLAACTSETASEKSATRATSPAAPAAGAVAPPPAQRTAASATQPRSLVWAPVDSISAQPVVASRPTNQPSVKRTRRARRPASPGLGIAATGQLGAAPAVPPASKQPTLLPTAFPAEALPVLGQASVQVPDTAATKLTQVFRIRPNRDTVLYGLEGTVLRVPAGTFVQGRGQGTAPAGEVELKLREFYSMADILLARLSTMAGPKLLETGGMVQLSATSGGQECKLRPGSDFELGFPATRPLDGMQLYTGQATATHGLNWKLTATTRPPKAKVRPTASRHWGQPHFVGGYADARDALRKAIVYSPATVRQLNGGQAPHQLRRQLARVGKRAPIVGKVEASFELSEKGQVTDVVLRNAGQADSVLEAAVRRALYYKVAAGPSHRGKEPTRSLMKVDVRFTADRRVLVEHLRWDRPATIALYQADAERKAMGGRPLTDAQLQAAPLDVVTGTLFKNRQANARRYSLTSYLGEQVNYLSGQLNRAKELTVFRVKVVAVPRSVGWYNCDRPLPPLLARLSIPDPGVRRVRAPGSAAQLAMVRLGLETLGQPADISLVLRDNRCVIRGDAREGRIHFEQLADGAAATLVAIRREQGQLYLAQRDIVVSQHTEPALEFQPVTVAELKTAVAQFDL